MKTAFAALAIALLAGCGGSPSELGVGRIISSAQAQSTEPGVGVRVYHLHAILRPDSGGRWYVQKDIDHEPVGISWELEQGEDFLRVHFFRYYTHAGAIQISSDDDFGGRVKGYSNLGLASATIRIEVDGRRINPAHILQYMPSAASGGNLWVSVTMVDKQ